MVRRPSLRGVLKAHAYRVWKEVIRSAGIPDVEESGTAEEDGLTIVVLAYQTGSETQPDEKMPGKYLSPTEQLIWNALEEKALVGKVIAARIKDQYDSTFKTLLSNLVQRGVITPDENGGYRRGEVHT